MDLADPISMYIFVQENTHPHYLFSVNRKSDGLIVLRALKTVHKVQ
jgi:hypothetical protein